MTDFMRLARPAILDLYPYQPGKPIEELERELGISNSVKLASNENPRGVSPLVLAALSDACINLPRYPDGSAFLLKQRLEEFLGVEKNWITVGNGSNEILELLARVFLGTETESIISEHAFVVYAIVTRAQGARVVQVPAENYGQNLDAVLEAVTECTRMIFIANPNNPTGTWLSKSELVCFLEQIRADIVVVLDEAYCEYVMEPEYPNGLDLIKNYDNLVVTRTFSKAYGLAGLRIGYSISNPDIAELMNRVRQPFNVNSMSLSAALVALDDQQYVRESVRLNTEGMKFLTQVWDRLGIDYIKSVGNFMSIDVGGGAAKVYDGLLNEGVIVRPLDVYGLPNHLRVTVGLPEENARCADALHKVLNRG